MPPSRRSRRTTPSSPASTTRCAWPPASPRATTKTINNGFVVDRYYKDGYAQTWNFAIEQNLTKTWVLELSYLGTKGTRLDIQRAPNRALPGSPLTAEDRRLIGNAVGFTYETSDGNSIFHAGQARLTRKLSKGLSVQGLYTYSKSIDDASVLGGGSAVVAQNDKDLRAERGLSTFDQRQSFSLGFTEQSPVGKKRPLASPAATGILRSWILAGNIAAMSGLPYTARVLGQPVGFRRQREFRRQPRRRHRRSASPAEPASSTRRPSRRRRWARSATRAATPFRDRRGSP